MPRRRTAPVQPNGKKIEPYQHEDKKRLNNPPVGLVTPETDPESGKPRKFAYDPHLDPQLVWAGKAERTSFEVPVVSLHVHERIEPLTIIEAVRRRAAVPQGEQLSLFSAPQENPPLREAVDFYKHPHGWSNRLIAGDSLLVMTSLLEKEALAGQVQMVYVDPPYGISYNSNFQPFVNKREVRDGRDEDLTQEPEMLKAFRDTWECGLHSYLSYLRDRLLLARELLSPSGSSFIQINDENVHLARAVGAEVFGSENYVVTIVVKKKGATTGREPINDYLLWFAKDKSSLKARRLFLPRQRPDDDPKFNTLIGPSGDHVRVTDLSTIEINKLETRGYRWARVNYPIVSQHPSATRSQDFVWNGKRYTCPANGQWRYDPEVGLPRLADTGRLFDGGGSSLGGVVYWDDWPHVVLSNMWDDLHGEQEPIYVVQTNRRIVERCLLMTTDPSDVVFDPTCGSGTTAFVAEKWGRRWITCDTSRVAVALAKQRLMTAGFDYFGLAHPAEGVGSGFRYETAQHIELAQIARGEPPMLETLYDHPIVNRGRSRVTGPFTVEAVPAPTVQPLDASGLEHSAPVADQSLTRSGETLRQHEWREELFRAGIRGPAGQRIMFSRVEALSGTRHLHADAETKVDAPERAVVSFGPAHAPLEQRQVALAVEEAQTLGPRPRLIVFAAFEFDPEAAKDIDETRWPGVSLLKVKMNADLLNDDLKKKRTSNEGFWLVGQPDVDLRRIAKGEDTDLWEVEARGFDYFDTQKGELLSGGPERIAMWLLDPDYDGRSLYPRQVFFPMADKKGGWSRLAKTLRAEIDESLIEQYRGTVSLPFELGPHRRVAVKIVDDRGVESLKIIGVD